MKMVSLHDIVSQVGGDVAVLDDLLTGKTLYRAMLRPPSITYHPVGVWGEDITLDGSDLRCLGYFSAEWSFVMHRSSWNDLFVELDVMDLLA